MIDRGLRRGFDPAVEREARVGRGFGERRRGRRTCARCPRSRSTRARPATTTTRSRLRPRETGRWRVWVHIADVSAYVAPRVAGRPRGLPARDQRLRPGRGRADAAGGAVQQRAARSCPGRTGRRSRSRWSWRGRRCVKRFVLPLGDPLRRAARLRPGGPHLRRRRASADAVGGAAGRRARGRRGARRAAGQAGGAGARLGRARVRVRRRRGTWSAIEPVAQTESHRLIEHLMIAANEQVARFLESTPGAGAVPRPRAPGRDGGGAADRAAGLARGAHSARPARPHDPAAGGGAGG